MRPHPFIALTGWLAFWLVNQALMGPGSETSLAFAVTLWLLPQLLLGLFAGRWWVASAPVAVGVYDSIWVANHPTSALSEIQNVWVLLVGVGLIAAVPVVVGIALSRRLQTSRRAT